MGTTEQGPALPPMKSPARTDGNTSSPTGLAASESKLPATGGTDGFGGYGKSFLTDSVSRGQANNPGDVRQVSEFLTRNRIMDSPVSQADEDFFQAVERGQDKLNALAGDGLRRDGIVKPWGPTEILSQRAISSGQMKPPASTPSIQQASDKRIDLPPPYTSVLPPKADKPPATKPTQDRSFQDSMRDLLDIIAKRQVHLKIPVDEKGKPLDSKAVNIRDDTLERLTRIIDNLLAIGTRFQAPTVFESTVKKPQGNDDWI